MTAAPEPIWFVEDTALTTASAATWGEPRVCVLCAEPIVRESCMSTVDGWVHVRCDNAAREEYRRRDPEF